jgi:hypothetical protein
VLDSEDSSAETTCHDDGDGEEDPVEEGRIAVDGLDRCFGHDGERRVEGEWRERGGRVEGERRKSGGREEEEWRERGGRVEEE